MSCVLAPWWIGAATGAALNAQGAEVVLLDRDAEGVTEAAAQIDGLAVPCDVTDGASVVAAFHQVA